MNQIAWNRLVCSCMVRYDWYSHSVYACFSFPLLSCLSSIGTYRIQSSWGPFDHLFLFSGRRQAPTFIFSLRVQSMSEVWRRKYCQSCRVSIRHHSFFVYILFVVALSQHQKKVNISSPMLLWIVYDCIWILSCAMTQCSIVKVFSSFHLSSFSPIYHSILVFHHHLRDHYELVLITNLSIPETYRKSKRNLWMRTKRVSPNDKFYIWRMHQ